MVTQEEEQHPAFCVIRDGQTSFRATKTPGASICSLVPSATAILHALGVGDRVVGITDSCRRTPETSKEALVVSRKPHSEETPLEKVSKDPIYL